MTILYWIVGIIVFCIFVNFPAFSFVLAIGIAILGDILNISDFPTILWVIIISLFVSWFIGGLAAWGNALNRGQEIVNKLERHLDEEHEKRG